MQPARLFEACVPGSHFWHAACPFTVTSPAAHGTQLVSPPALAHLAGHALHVRVDASSYLPGTHGSQLRRALSVAHPVWHGSQSEAPSSLLNQSSGHAVHWSWPADTSSPYVPASHSSHSVLSSLAAFPAGHAQHVSLRPADTCPAAHGLHSERGEPDAYVPAGQSSQAVAPDALYPTGQVLHASSP